MATGTGSAGSNQNGAVPTGPAGTPGDILTISGPLSINASLPVVDKDFADMMVTTSYDLAVRDAQRPNLILDQFATEKPSNETHNGATRRVFFMDDISEQTTPLLENLDVDSVVISGRYLDLSQREYGVTVARTRLLAAQTMVPFDPVAARKVGWNSARSIDALARTAYTAATLVMKTPSGSNLTGTIGKISPTLSNGSPGYLSTEVLQEGTTMLAEQNAEPFVGEEYVLVVTPRGLQHLKAESQAGGWRDVTMRNPGAGGNDIMRGYVGTYEGVHVVVSRNMTAGKALLFGAEAFAKVFPQVGGFSAYPEPVISPVTDSLRRFAKIGWRWIGGYSIFRPQNVINITHGTVNRALGATNNALGATAYSEA